MRLGSLFGASFLLCGATLPGCESGGGNQTPANGADGGISDGGDDTTDASDYDAGEGDGGTSSEARYAIADFAWEDPRGNAFQPLTRNSYRAIRSEELAVFVPDQATAQAGFALDDRVGSGAVTPLTSSQTAHIYDVVRGDADDDGNDEALIVRLNESGAALLSCAQLGGSTFEEQNLHTIAGPAKTYARIAAGDMDGDLRDEIVVATLDGAHNLRIDVFEDLLDLKVLDTLDFPDTRLFDVSRGDFDGDGIDELVVLRENGSDAVSAHFFKLSGNALVDAGVLEGSALALNDAEYDNRRLQVVAGDLDGDDRDEAVLGAIRHHINGGTNEVRLFAYEDAVGARAFIEEIASGIEIDNWPLDERIGWHLAAADTNGDRRAEFVSLVPSLDQSAGSQRRYYLDHFSFKNEALADQKFASEMRRYTVTQNDTVHQETGGWLAVLDDERSGQDTVVVSVLDAQPADDFSPSRELELYRYRASYNGTSWSLSGGERDTFPLTTQASDIENWVNPVVLGLDLDADSLKLEYTGEKWLSLPEPFVLVVMAAPPVQHDLSHNFASSGTAYGHEVSESKTEAEEIGTTVGATVSFETPAIAGIFSYQASASIERELAKTQANTQLETHGTSFAGSALHDYVIFQGTLYTSYKYKVVAAADPSAVGTYMTLDEPVSTKLYKWTVDYFNATIADSEYHLGPDLFQHKPGDVASYGGESRKSRLIAEFSGWQSNPVVTLGQGEGSNRTYLNLSEEATNTTTLNMTKSVSAGASVAGLGFEGSMALREGQEWSISVGEQVAYEGTVGDIASAGEYQEFSYSFGLFVYNWKASDNSRSFQVIDYWVEALGPGYSQE